MTARLSASDHITDNFPFGVAGSKPGQNRFAPRIMKFAEQNHNQINQNANPQTTQSQKPDNSSARLAVIKAVLFFRPGQQGESSGLKISCFWERITPDGIN
jgi:hypothetical protein